MSASGAVFFVARVDGTDICHVGVSSCLDDRFQRMQKLCHREVSLAVVWPIGAGHDPHRVLSVAHERVGQRGTHLRGAWYRIDRNNLDGLMVEFALEFND